LRGDVEDTSEQTDDGKGETKAHGVLLNSEIRGSLGRNYDISPNRSHQT
jgi:hypothetical protein